MPTLVVLEEHELAATPPGGHFCRRSTRSGCEVVTSSRRLVSKKKRSLFAVRFLRTELTLYCGDRACILRLRSAAIERQEW